MRPKFITVLGFCTVLGGAIGGQPAERVGNDEVFQRFRGAVDAYVQLHRRLEQDVPALTSQAGAYEIIASSDALAKAIQAARVGAREGDVFTPGEADSFRAVIATALQTSGFAVADIVAAGAEEAPAEAPLLAVNDRFRWAHGAAIWPCMLLGLPELPEELQFRVVGRDLVLVDVHANLVVDVLRKALR